MYVGWLCCQIFIRGDVELRGIKTPRLSIKSENCKGHVSLNSLGLGVRGWDGHGIGVNLCSPFDLTFLVPR